MLLLPFVGHVVDPPEKQVVFYLLSLAAVFNGNALIDE